VILLAPHDDLPLSCSSRYLSSTIENFYAVGKAISSLIDRNKPQPRSGGGYFSLLPFHDSTSIAAASIAVTVLERRIEILRRRTARWLT
jgi:hypothetical protein